MQLRVTLLHIVALLALVLSTLGDGLDTTPRVCTIKLNEQEEMYGKIGSMAMSCLESTAQQLGELKSLEDHMTFFKNICDKKQQIRDCLAEVELTSAVCQNETQHRDFKILCELLETTLDSGCVHDGEVIASAATIYKASLSGPFHGEPFRDCVSIAMEKVMYVSDEELALSSLFFLLYRTANNMKECFGNVEGHTTTSTNIKSIVGDIANKMKCVHPQDETTVLCTSIDITLPDVPRICPIKSHDDERSHMYDILNEQVSWCFLSTYHSSGGNVGDIETLDMSHAFMKHFCQKKRIVEQCWSDVEALSSVCLNVTEQNLIKVGVDPMKTGFDYGCIDDGQPFGHVLLKISRDMKNTTENAVKGCMSIVGHLDNGERKAVDAARILLYYQQLKVFKECFINKMRGDNTAVLNAQTFLNSVQRNMKCINEEHGTIVLCDTIDPTPQTGIKDCPLVGENENAPPEYEMFVDQGLKCLKASRVDLDRLDHFSTIEEFRTFFDTFCHNRMSVKHCVDNLSSLSAVCQNQTNHQMLSIFTDFLGTTLETGCQQDGEVLATVVHGFMFSAATDRVQTKGCLDTVSFQVKNGILNADGLSAKSLVVYRALESMKGCLTHGHGDADEGTFKTVFVSFLNDIIRGLKCIHPDVGTTVLCETIVNN